MSQSLLHTYKRYRTLKTNMIRALPIVILMPHSACNCRCVMCDIWKGNKNLKQLAIEDVQELLISLKKLGTKQVVFSGGEALLNPNFFALCKILKVEKLHITLLSTGLTLKKHADDLLQWADDIIVSLDGDEQTHNLIRNIPDAYAKLKEGVQYIKSLRPSYRITARTVVHRLNFKKWPTILECAKEIGVDQVSFLPADVSSQAFNREILWSEERQGEVALAEYELPQLKAIIDELLIFHRTDFENYFIAEPPEKIRQIYTYYKALHGLAELPYRKCNAPWVSAVIEPDGSVKPCFFHSSIGNIRSNSLPEILNNKSAIAFRKELKATVNETCRRCVCSLNLPAWANPVSA